MIKLITHSLAFLTVLLQLLLTVIVIIRLGFWKKIKTTLKSQLVEKLEIASFLVAIIATGGSLFFSLVAGFTPCELCWYQRIFMYPQVILLGLGMIKADKNALDYSLALAIIGAIISVYQNYLIWFNTATTFCSKSSSASCVQPYVLEFSYITIPLMALTAFLALILFTVIIKIERKK